MAFNCKHCGGKHENVAEAKVCAGLGGTTIAPPAPVRATHTASQGHSSTGRSRVIYRDAAPTDSQEHTARGLGIDLDRSWTRGTLGDEIARVLAEKKEKRVTQPAQEPAKPKTKVPLDMLQSVGPGYYAVRLDANRVHTFFVLNKVEEIKGVRRKLPIGTFTVETLHGDNRKPVLTIFPNGTVKEFDLSKENELLMVCVDPNGGKIEFGIQRNRCGQCGKGLTDDRSRWYAIGPDCEKRHGHIISIVDEMYGPYRVGYTHKDRLADEGK